MSPWKQPRASALDALGGFVPRHGGLTKVGLVGHMAGQSRVVSEDRVLDDRLTSTNRLEESPQMRLDVVVVRPAERHAFLHRLLSQLRIVFLVPCADIRGAHG